MRYVSYWTGGPIPKRALRNLERNAKRVGGIELFCDEPTDIKGVECYSAAELLDSIIMGRSEWAAWLTLLLTNYWSAPNFPEDMAVSDFVRLYLGTKIPDMVWVDCDVKLYTPVPEDNRLMMAEYFGPRVDHCLFAVNGCCEQVADILRELCDQPQVTRRSLYQIVNRQPNVGAISQRVFKHK